MEAVAINETEKIFHENIDNNAYLRVRETVNQYGDVYQYVYIYYKDTDEVKYLGMIYSEDVSHLNMKEFYIFSKNYYIVIRKNRVTGEIVDYKKAFDIKRRCDITEDNELENLYKRILEERLKEEKKKNKSNNNISNTIINSMGKVLDFFNPFK